MRESKQRLADEAEGTKGRADLNARFLTGPDQGL